MLKTFDELFARKDYSQALTFLQEHHRDVSPELWHYNVGTAYGKLGNWPLARFHFLTAKSEGLNEKEVLDNLSVSEVRLDIQKLERAQGARDYAVKAGLILSEGYLSTVSLVILIASLFALRKKVSFLRIAVAFLLIGLPLVLDFWIKSWPKAIVVKENELKDGPSVIFAQRGQLPLGLFVVGKQSGDWIHILYPSRFEGWTTTNGLQVLE